MNENNYIGKNKYELDTPVLLIDKTKLLKNLSIMQNFAKQNKVNVRPHAKTHKCSVLAKLQLEYGAVGICVAKVSEGLELARSGIRGILITSPVVTNAKINILFELLKLAPDVILVIDNLINADELNKRCIISKTKLNIILDIDAGIGRTGVSFEQALNYARKLNKYSHLNFKGIQCYAGHIQHIADLSERALISSKIITTASKIKQQLLDEGIPCHIQTGSGTGTFTIDAEITGVTEIQPGSYCVMDKEYFDIQYKQSISFEPAMTMLTSVISSNHLTHVTVDAGTKALYRVDTRPKVISHPHLNYDWDSFGDEQGKVTANEGAMLPPLGEVLELVVGHCDPTINLFDYFYIIENDIVIERWDINLRGRCC